MTFVQRGETAHWVIQTGHRRWYMRVQTERGGVAHGYTAEGRPARVILYSRGEGPGFDAVVDVGSICRGTAFALLGSKGQELAALDGWIDGRPGPDAAFAELGDEPETA